MIQAAPRFSPTRILPCRTSFIFSAASPAVISVPSVMWLFGSCLLELAAVSQLRRLVRKHF